MVSATLLALIAAPDTEVRPCTSAPSIVKNRRVRLSMVLR